MEGGGPVPGGSAARAFLHGLNGVSCRWRGHSPLPVKGRTRQGLCEANPGFTKDIAILGALASWRVTQGSTGFTRSSSKRSGIPRLPGICPWNCSVICPSGVVHIRNPTTTVGRIQTTWVLRSPGIRRERQQNRIAVASGYRKDASGDPASSGRRDHPGGHREGAPGSHQGCGIPWREPHPWE